MANRPEILRITENKPFSSMMGREGKFAVKQAHGRTTK